MKNKANLTRLNLTANSCSRGGYNVLRAKPQNGTKPNKANLTPISKWRTPRFPSETQAKNFFMESKANFPNPSPILTPETKSAYINSHPQNHKKSKPNPKPVHAHK